MPDRPIQIRTMAEQLNLLAANHPIGRLQSIRKGLHGFSRRTGSTIFTTQTIHSTYAFHHGGRRELQFNIGTEAESGHLQMRHGVAFSFELSRNLRSIDVLILKAARFNEFIQLYPEYYADMRMWHHRRNERSSDYPPAPIVSEIATPGTFVFMGKRQSYESIDLEIVLNDFDRLLSLYEYVESGSGRLERDLSAGEGFQFRPGVTARSPAARATLAQRELDLNLKHNLLQAALCRRLIAEYGSENVGDEHPGVARTKIDVVLRRNRREFWYYEIKTAQSPRACLREALGQLLEYAYWPRAQEARRLIVCGESPLDDDGKIYLRLLRRRFRLPIEYQQIVA
jgi:hypothetical protein